MWCKWTSRLARGYDHVAVVRKDGSIWVWVGQL